MPELTPAEAAAFEASCVAHETDVLASAERNVAAAQSKIGKAAAEADGAVAALASAEADRDAVAERLATREVSLEALNVTVNAGIAEANADPAAEEVI